jgi:hypothetical protein
MLLSPAVYVTMAVGVVPRPYPRHAKTTMTVKTSTPSFQLHELHLCGRRHP